MRNKTVKVLGKVQASFYSSVTTAFVECGGFFTIWSTVYLITHLSNSWVEAIFLQPYSYIFVSHASLQYSINFSVLELFLLPAQAITRVLIIMRMAQDRAWSKDIIAAALDGELDWQISSTNTASIVLHNLNDFESSNCQNLSDKFIIHPSLRSKPDQ